MPASRSPNNATPHSERVGIDRSATGTEVVADLSWSSSVAMLLLGVESGSFWSAAVTCATLVKSPVAFTEAVIVSVADPPLAIEPIAQTPVRWCKCPSQCWR